MVSPPHPPQVWKIDASFYWIELPQSLLSPYEEFQKLKNHTSIRPLLENGTVLQYGARTLIEGGFQFVRVGSNPKFALVAGHHWFDGDGLAHQRWKSNLSLPVCEDVSFGIRGIFWRTKVYEGINRTLRNVNFDHDQPAHLRLQIPERVNLPKYGGPESRFFPARVYEYIPDDNGQPKLQINAQNRLHCKLTFLPTCNIEEEDGAKVVRVENLKNPYMSDDNHDRFKLTLNKLYAWSLVEYDRIIMLDADNIFLQNTDELFQCGQFCAVLYRSFCVGAIVNGI
ncbi:putative glucuronosyltransferase PGSIP8 [Tanacetum coccineum]